MTKVEEYKRDFLEAWEKIDAEKVAAAIQDDPRPLPDYDFQDAKACVFAGAEKWLVRDLREFNLTGVEKLVTDLGLKAVLDLVGTMTGTGGEDAFKDYIGAGFAADWKITRSTFNPTWDARYLDAWQWKIYTALVPGLRLFFYRGIKRPTTLGASAETRELIIDVDRFVTDVRGSSRKILGQVTELIKILTDKGETPWPKHMPDACNAFGRECPYYQECTLHAEPGGLPEARPLSYTRMSTFLQCPERYRRNVLDTEAGLDEEENEDTRFGKAVHRGLAEVYGQAFNIKQDELREGTGVPSKDGPAEPEVHNDSKT